MSLKAVTLDQGKVALHPALIVNIFRHQELVERIARRGVDKESVSLAVQARPVRQRRPAAFTQFGVLARRFQLLSGPEDRSLGHMGGREAVRAEQGRVVELSEEGNAAQADEVDALPRIGAVSDGIAEEVDGIGSLSL